MQAILEFYQPYVSYGANRVGKIFEIVMPLCFSALFAVSTTIPFFMSGRYLSGFGWLLLSFFLIHTFRCTMMRYAAERRPNGNLYISPSRFTSIRMVASSFSLVLTMLLLLVALWLAPPT